LLPAACRHCAKRWTNSLAQPGQNAWDQFNQAQASGDPEQLLTVAQQASDDVRSNMYQQIAWQFASSGDLQRVRQIADKLTDPFRREQVLQQSLRQSAFNAANQGQFAGARQLAQEITPDEDRATILAQLSPMDLESRRRWAEYSRAKDEMFAVTDIKQAPWYVVDAENKKCARLNIIRHLLSLIPYRDLTPERLKLPPLDKTKYVRPPIQEQNFIPQVYRSGD
jgi:polyphosphate kinase 2 PPK2